MRLIDADALYNGTMKDEYFRFKETDKSGREAFAYSCAMQRLVEAPTIQPDAPRVMTLEELKEYVSLPPVFVDDLSMQEDYLQDIAPLYTDFPDPEESWIVHWRDAFMLRQNLANAGRSYGKTWRCWTARPTEEQRKAVKWDE